jgi:ferric-dicitrate binding protein FerR (iron transport regulator)
MSLPGDIAALIGDHLDGTLTAEGGRRLEAWLAADPANRRHFLRLVMDHQALIGQVAAWPAPAPVRSWPLVTALAAALVLALIGWQLWPAPATTTTTTTTAAATMDNQPLLMASAATRLVAGATVTGEATLRWDDGSTVRLATGSSVTIGSGLALHLEHGRIAVETAAQPPHRPARFTAPGAEMVVVGTSLAITAADGESVTEVTHGQVRVRRTGDGSEVLVGAGASVAVVPGLALRVRPLGAPVGQVHRIVPGDALPESVAPGDVVEFAAGTHLGAWRWTASGTTLRPITLRGAADATTVIDASATPTTGAHAGPRAAVQLEGRNLVIERLTLTGARNRSNASGIRLTTGAAAVTIRGCRISGCDQGITSDPGTGELLIEDCTITGNGAPERPGRTHNLNLAGVGSTVRGCRISDAPFGLNVKLLNGQHRLVGNRLGGGADGEISLDLSADANGRLDLLGNLVVGTARTGAWNHRRFISVNRPTGGSGRMQVAVIANTLVVNDPRNVLIDAVGCEVELTGCIITGSDRLVSPGTGLGGRDNLLPAAADDCGLAGSRHGDPGFRDPAAGDYRLSGTSPGRGMVLAQPAVAPDLEPPGIDAPAGMRPSLSDAGAYQAR